MIKLCKKCNTIKSDFYKSKYSKDGYRYTCNQCEYSSNKKWVKKNREKINRYHRLNRNKEYELSYQKRRLKEDINYKLAKYLRSRLYMAIRNNKPGSAVKDLGCTVEQFKLHIESKWLIGMSWANYGKEWHIDHIQPLSKFELKNRPEFLIACNYLNLQPLWAKDNLSKHSK